MKKNIICINYQNLSTKNKVDNLKLRYNRYNNYEYAELFFLNKEYFLNNRIISNIKYNKILEEYSGEYEILIELMNKFKVKISDLALLKNSIMFSQLLDELIFIRALVVLYKLEAIRYVISEEDINNLDDYEPIQTIYLENIAEVKEKRILDKLNELDEIIKFNLLINKIFNNYYLKDGKASIYECLKNKLYKKELPENSYVNIAVFSGFRPNVDYRLEDLVNFNLAKIDSVLFSKYNDKNYKFIKNEMKSIFPKFKNNIEYITNIKTINIPTKYNKYLYHINKDNILEYFSSVEFIRFIEEYNQLGNNNRFVYVHNEEINYKYNIELDLGNDYKIKFYFIYINMKDLIIETRAKLSGKDVEKLTEYELLKRGIINTNYMQGKKTKDIEQLVKNKLYYEIQDLYKNSVFLFKDSNYKEIKYLLKKNNINISSGMNTLKHKVNILDFRIIKFLSTLYDNSIQYELINNSFQHCRNNKLKYYYESAYKIYTILDYKECKYIILKIKLENNEIKVEEIYTDESNEK